MAAASSFYVILTILPLALLIIRIVGFFIGDIFQTQEYIFQLGENLLPNVAPEILLKAKSLLQGPLFGGVKVTFINLAILIISSLSFFNSIWNGLYLMTGDKGHTSIWKYLKGLVIIAFTIGLVVFLLGLGPILNILLETAKNNFLMDFLWSHLIALRPYISYFQELKIEDNFLLNSSIPYVIIFIGYFSLLYRWFFSWRISFRESLLGASTFALFLVAGKSFFYIYFMYVRESLVANYGDYYTFIVAIIWVFLVMSCFFYAAALCYTLEKDPLFSRKKLA